ncbi:hypothetical protein J437_LFUL004136, partial [Ladona fulva]
RIEPSYAVEGVSDGAIVPINSTVQNPEVPNARGPTAILSGSGGTVCCQLVRDIGNDRTAPHRSSRRVVYSVVSSRDDEGRAEVREVEQEDENPEEAPEEAKRKKKKEEREQGDDALTTALSALYAKLLVVLGIALPVTEVISTQVPPYFYQGFYLYLYGGSLLFVFLMHAILLRQRALNSIVRSYAGRVGADAPPGMLRKTYAPVRRFCSFYLRVGAIGDMIYSGLEFGQFFELREEQKCHQILQAITPVTRMVLTIVQMHFIFLNNKQEDMRRHKTFARFGLMHMIAMNICEWLYVIVEETKHEIVHLRHQYVWKHHEGNETSVSTEVPLTMGHHDPSELLECRRTNIMGALVQNASPFLFPCTIEYSLICAVILYALWKDVSKAAVAQAKFVRSDHATFTRSLSTFFSRSFRRQSMRNSAELFSVDCANAHRGLFGGILVLVLTIISLITFFVLVHAPGFAAVAVFEVTVCEMVLYVLTTAAVIVCAVQMRDLRYGANGPHRKLGLDNALLVAAQTGMYMYCMFAIVGAYFANSDATLLFKERFGINATDSAASAAASGAGSVAVEVCSLVQTTCQTIFVLDACCRRCKTVGQFRRKPGRQLVTFLLVANMAMWTINTLEKNRAEFHPTHLHFYGVWAWTVITHVSMPLAIFYRFHSTVCLYEIWKVAYKMKHNHPR